MNPDLFFSGEHLNSERGYSWDSTSQPCGRLRCSLVENGKGEKNLKKQKAKKMKPGLARMKQGKFVPISQAEAMKVVDRITGQQLRETLEKAGTCTQLATSALAPTYQALLEFGELVSKAETIVKEELKKRAFRDGQLQPTGGYNLQTEDGWVIPLTPHTPQGTLDDKKVEAMLRTKGLNVEDFMEEKVTYKANRLKLEEVTLGGNGETPAFSEEDIKSCEKPPVWSLQKLRRVEDRGDAERVSTDEGGEP